ncbi:MAG: hypothetical protein SGPRY_006784, partial [Prymnesium sp.]
VVESWVSASIDQPGKVDNAARALIALKDPGDQRESRAAQRRMSMEERVDNLQVLQELRASATTGLKLLDLRILCTGALIVLLETEEGRTKFHEIKGNSTLLSLFKRPEQASGEAACQLFLSMVSTGSARVQMHSCKLFLDHGLEALVRIITGRRPFSGQDNVETIPTSSVPSARQAGASVSPSGRLVAAGGLTYCVAHSPYHALRMLAATSKREDPTKVRSYSFSSLIGQLRAGIVGMLLPIATHISQLEKYETPEKYAASLESAKAAVHLIASTTACIWGLAQPLFTRREPLSAYALPSNRTQGITMVRKRSAAEWVLYKSFVNPLRNAALAVLSCLEVESIEANVRAVLNTGSAATLIRQDVEEAEGFAAAKRVSWTHLLATGITRPIHGMQHAKRLLALDGFTRKRLVSGVEERASPRGGCDRRTVASPRYARAHIHDTAPADRASGAPSEYPLSSAMLLTWGVEISSASLAAVSAVVASDLIEQGAVARVVNLIRHLHTLRQSSAKSDDVKPLSASRASSQPHLELLPTSAPASIRFAGLPFSVARNSDRSAFLKEHF